MRANDLIFPYYFIHSHICLFGRILKILVFTISTLLFLTHQFTQWVLEISIPFLDNYLDPFLAMPFLLFLLDLEMTFFRMRPQLQLSEILASFLIFSIIFELFFPFLSADFTGDFWDIIAYFFGTMLYYLVREYDEMPKFA